MLYDRNKCYPYPVLRPDSSDYPNADFQVDVQLEQEEKSTALRVKAKFAMGEQDLKRLVKTGFAEYILHVTSPSTRFRTAVATSNEEAERNFERGCLAGPTTIRGLLIATKCISKFRSDGWNDCYHGTTFSISEGTVLAEDEPKHYWIESGEETTVGSIFLLSQGQRVKNGTWECILAQDKVVIRMSKQDYQRFLRARNRVNGRPDAAYIFNSVYLPALIYTLEQGDRGAEEYQSCRWYHSLNEALKRKELGLLGEGNHHRLRDAQKLLEYPFGNMPMLGEEG